MLMTKFSLNNIAHMMATAEFNERCVLLDTQLEDALTIALNSEKRMSNLSRKRVVDKFCKILLKK